MVDRITPRADPADVDQVARDTGVSDECPVVTEPFREWVLAGEFPAGRPQWESAGAVFTDDITPYEQRKLWLLNGGHSLLAYLGPLRGHETVAAAVADDVCRGWLQAWWSEAAAELGQSPDATAGYQEQLLGRFANPRIRHRLEQIAADGSQKLAIRVVPVIRAGRADGTTPLGATRILAGWLHHLRGDGVPVVDVDAATIVDLAAGRLVDAVPRVLASLDPALAADTGVVAAVAEQYEMLAAR
jgi:fructuronate reductase